MNYIKRRKKKEEKPKTKKEIVKMLLNKNNIEANDDNNDLDELIDLLIDQPISIDVDKKERENQKFGDTAADKLTSIAGSWLFVIFFIIFLIIWIIINIKMVNSFDPYPFILLNLFLSCIAAIQAPIIMMSQNRSAKKDTMRSENNYKTALKSELILEELHDKIERLITNQNRIIKYIEQNEIEKNNNQNKKV